MSDSYSHARIVSGFKGLLDELRELEQPNEIGKRIRANTEARQAAQERVRREYAAYGIETPSDLALSMTARKELGIGIVWVPESEEEKQHDQEIRADQADRSRGVAAAFPRARRPGHSVARR